MRFGHSAAVASVATKAVVLFALLVGIALDFALQMPSGRGGGEPGLSGRANATSEALADSPASRLLHVVPQTNGLADLAIGYAPRGGALAVAGALAIGALVVARRRGAPRRGEVGSMLYPEAFQPQGDEPTNSSRVRGDSTPVTSVDGPGVDPLARRYGTVRAALRASSTCERVGSLPLSERHVIHARAIGSVLDLLGALSEERANFPPSEIGVPEIQQVPSDFAIALAQRTNEISEVGLLRRIDQLQQLIEDQFHLHMGVEAA